MGKAGKEMHNEKIIQEQGVVVGNVYNKTKETHPIFSILIKNYYRDLNDLVMAVRPRSIHETGCGEGYVISRFQKKGISLSGSDFSTIIIEKAKSLYGDSQIKFITRSVYELTQEESAELILCCEVLEHLENPEIALEKIS